LNNNYIKYDEKSLLKKQGFFVLQLLHLKKQIIEIFLYNLPALSSYKVKELFIKKLKILSFPHL